MLGLFTASFAAELLAPFGMLADRFGHHRSERPGFGAVAVVLTGPRRSVLSADAWLGA
jgi:hypothetical protein